MPKTAAFDLHSGKYDVWFDRHPAAYISELLAMRALVPWTGRGLEIGVGTGRFAGPLGIRLGLDPSQPMLARAATRGMDTVAGVAEALPFASGSLDHAMAVTTICFVDSPALMMSEARRVLRPGGRLVIGFIDRDSWLGRHYTAHRDESTFYRDAVFHSVTDVGGLLADAGFRVSSWGQTLTQAPGQSSDIEPLQEGTGRGAFVVVAAEA